MIGCAFLGAFWGALCNFVRFKVLLMYIKGAETLSLYSIALLLYYDTGNLSTKYILFDDEIKQLAVAGGYGVFQSSEPSEMLSAMYLSSIDLPNFVPIFIRRLLKVFLGGFSSSSTLPSNFKSLQGSKVT